MIHRLDLSYSGWVSRISLYIHELTHTIEFQLQNEDFYGIHAAGEYISNHYGPIKTEFDFLYGYLRNEINIGGRNVGIPYEFWTGEYERQ
ncbi:hypothetical protein [Thomasclavelia cocleata]|uniref:hypothetical protein n=1 Tax=Thomasclavelia cocleata TaxID=69824 RepID=UPI002590D30D|nr:hypothetical protein [Thomasclavelia cocleata]MCI9182703.1 hypothetical protein [Acholeplasmatales bacterium]